MALIYCATPGCGIVVGNDEGGPYRPKVGLRKNGYCSLCTSKGRSAETHLYRILEARRRNDGTTAADLR